MRCTTNGDSVTDAESSSVAGSVYTVPGSLQVTRSVLVRYATMWFECQSASSQ